MQVVQQLTSSLVEGCLDAGTAQAIDGVLNGIQAGLGAAGGRGGSDRALVQP